MKIRCFYPNKDGKIVFTKDMLEKLLKEVYEEGHSDGYSKGYVAAHPITLTYPYTPYWYTSTDIKPWITCSGTTTLTTNTNDSTLTTATTSLGTAYINDLNDANWTKIGDISDENS